MGVRENKDFVKRLWDEGFAGPVDGLDRYFTAQYVDHSLWNNLAGLKTAVKAFRAAYPAATWKIEDMVGEGEKVAVRGVIEIAAATGTHRKIGSTTIYRFENGKVAETWAHGDPLF